jgi:hypothetical protein
MRIVLVAVAPTCAYQLVNRRTHMELLEYTQRHAALHTPGPGTLLPIENALSIPAVESRLPLPLATMPILEFIDSTGVAWRVWNTVPSARTTLSGEFERGWLTFESPAGALRRLAPVPTDWESAEPQKLELMCRAAAEVARRTGGVTDNEARTDPS